MFTGKDQKYHCEKIRMRTNYVTEKACLAFDLGKCVSGQFSRTIFIKQLAWSSPLEINKRQYLL